VKLGVIWEGEVISIEAPASATVGELRPLLTGHPNELWVAARRFRDDEPIGRIPNGSTLRGEEGVSRPVPEVEEGRFSLRRPPRLAPQPLPHPLAPPALPEPPTRRPQFRWAAAAVPLVSGLALGLYFGPMMAAFSLLGVLMALGSWIEDHLAIRRETRAVQKEVRRLVAHHRRAEVVRNKKIEAMMASRMPSPDSVVGMATMVTRDVWARRPRHDDFGMVSVGTSEGVPLGLTLRAGMTVGISGPLALGLARWMVIQTVVHHGPADVAVRGPSTAEWSWFEWLPHPESGSAMEVAIGEPGGERTCGIVVAEDPDLLPEACDLVIRTGDHVELIWTNRSGMESGRPLAISGGDAREVATALACLDDPEAPSVGSGVSLDELLGAPTVGSIGETWQRHDAGLVARFGTGQDGVFELDLIGDGPHGLLAGTTGSGKSELLRSIVMSLAIRYPPERVVFVFADFKGGATFDPCVRLPHVAGSMTDLDPSGARKMVEALEIELRDRERILRQAGVSSLEPDDGRLPRLVILVDEFGALADQAPATLDGLVDIARRGRSLGIHLFLATQRPAGVVSDSIRANTSIRIALRVHSRADSQDVVGTDDAAHVDRRAPGRGFARLGPGELVAFSTAFVSGVSGEINVTPGPKLEAAQPSDLDRLVEAICRAAGSRPRARPVWSDSLPTVVRPDDIRSNEGVAIGAIDGPRHHGTLIWDGGNILVVDPAGRDAAVALLGIATAAASHGAHVHMAGVRRDSPLWNLGSFAGNVVGVGEEERAGRLINYLIEELDRRRIEVLGEPPILFVVEDFEPDERMERIVTKGPAVGVGVVAAVRHAGSIGGALLAGFPERLAFKLLDPYEYLALGIGSTPHVPHGAAISMAHQQVVRIVEPSTGIIRDDRIPRIEVLPNHVPLSAVAGRAADRNGYLFLPIGVGGTSTVGVEGPRIRKGHHVVVTGPRGSGKSTALRAVAASIAGFDSTVSPNVELVDDAHTLEKPPDLHACLVVAARAGDLPHGHWVRRLVSDAVGVCLQPDHRDEDLWRKRLPAGHSPGRGVLLERGRVVPIQIASGTMHPKHKEDQCEFG